MNIPIKKTKWTLQSCLVWKVKQKLQSACGNCEGMHIYHTSLLQRTALPICQLITQLKNVAGQHSLTFDRLIE